MTAEQYETATAATVQSAVYADVVRRVASTPLALYYFLHLIFKKCSRKGHNFLCAPASNVPRACADENLGERHLRSGLGPNRALHEAAHDGPVPRSDAFAHAVAEP